MDEFLSMDQVFIRKLTDIVLANLGNEKFDVKELIKASGLSSSSVHRKLRSITHKSVSQFIREIRLHRAMEMLQNNIGTASEIAFMTGFTTPTYFNKCFHEFYGCTPGQIKIRGSENPEDEILIPITSKYDQKRPVRQTIIIASSGILILALISYLSYSAFSKKFTIKAGITGINIEKSIAVLPFKNFSNDITDQYIYDGVMDEIFNNLSKIHVLRVISHTSVEQYRNTVKTIPQIGKELNVNYIVEGSGQRNGNTFRIRVQLIEVSTDKHTWTKSYQQRLKRANKYFRTQIRIAEDLASELGAVITHQEKQLITKTPTDNFEAYRLYRIGNFLMIQLNEDMFRKAIDYFQQAIELDSSFAQAYADQAYCYLNLSSWFASSPSLEYIPKARACAVKALEINKNLAEAYFVLGDLNYLHDWNWNGAEQAFKKGMENDPNCIWGRIEYANMLTALGRFEESITIGQQTLKLNPLDPIAYNELAFAMFLNDQDMKALELCNKSLELNPNFEQTFALLIQFYTRSGLFDQAISIWKKELKLNDNDIQKIPAISIGFAGQVFGMDGRHDEAINLLNELNRRAEAGANMHTYQAFIYAGLGQIEEAVKLLDKSFKEKDFFMVWLKVNSVFDSLRSNKQFEGLLREMRFKE